MNKVAKALEIVAIRDKATAFETIAQHSTNSTSQNYWYDCANQAMHQAFALCREYFPGASIAQLREQLQIDRYAVSSW